VWYVLKKNAASRCGYHDPWFDSMMFLHFVRHVLIVAARVGCPPTGRISVKSGIGDLYQNLPRKCEFGWNRAKSWSTSHEYGVLLQVIFDGHERGLSE
jgi:hypothetical protein